MKLFSLGFSAITIREATVGHDELLPSPLQHMLAQIRTKRARYSDQWWLAAVRLRLARSFKELIVVWRQNFTTRAAAMNEVATKVAMDCSHHEEVM